MREYFIKDLENYLPHSPPPPGEGIPRRSAGIYLGDSATIIRVLHLFICLLSLLFYAAGAEAAVVEHSGTISANTIWSGTDIHRITGDLTVSAGITLTIEPGTIIKFNELTRLNIHGALYAVGNSSGKIVFTSYRDDSFGGDINGDGFSTGRPGDWDLIYFADSVIDSLTRLEHTIIRFGGGSGEGSVFMNRVNVPLVSSEISYGSSYGIYTNQASPLIEANTISNNGSYGIYHYGESSPVDRINTITGNSDGIYVFHATPAINGNTITGNANWGIYYYDASNAPVITGNTITGNLQGIMIPAISMPNSTDGNILAPNSINGVWIWGNTRVSDLRFEALYPGEAHEINTYQIYDTLTMNEGKLLTVDPGVIVKFYANAGLTINGALSAAGTTALPVVFTSYKDDQYGGDLNLDGYATSPANGDWRGITFSNVATDTSCIIDHAVIRYGGTNGSGNIYSHQTDFTIRNSVISNSSTNGVRASQASLTLLDNEVFGNSGDGLRFESTGSHMVTGGRVFANFDDGIEVTGSVNATVTGSGLFGNLGYGLRSSSSNTITATGNWWGAMNGAGGSKPGTGDEVSANVTTTGFLTDGSGFSYFNAGPNISEGTIPGPAVIQGTDTSEWGATPTTRMLYDLEHVALDYPSVPTDSRFELFITYYNPDNTSGIGGNIQSLTDGDGQEIHGPLAIPSTTPTPYYYRLPVTSHDSGDLRLNFIRENGYRAVVSQVWVVEHIDTTDIAAPTSVITSPGAAAQLTGGIVDIRGTATDGAGSGILSVEVGIDSGSGISWRPVTQLRSDGGWTYRWDLPADGAYTLYARATDRAGNLEAAGAGVSVVVNQTPPVVVTGFSAFDTPADSGSSISISWVLSADDGAGANDISSYKVERREGGAGSFSVVGSVGAGAGTGSFTDATTVDGTQYDYRIVAVDLAGNQTASAVYGLVISVNNDGSDVTPPEDVTGLSATAGNGFVNLTWTRSLNTALDIIDQMLDISTDGGGAWGGVGPGYTDGGTLSLGKEASFRLVEGLANGTGYRFRIRVKDSSNNISSGTLTGVITPSATAVTQVSGAIASNTTWGAGVFYVSGDLTVNTGVTLTVNPGVIIKFATGTSITVLGNLTAVGTDGSPVVFTAWMDDAYGGDSNEDGPSSGTPGYWDKISFESSPASQIARVVVRYGGSGNEGNVYLNQSDVSVLGSTISHGSSYGLYTEKSSSLIEGNTITNNGGAGIYHYNTSSPVDRNNTITGNKHGIYVQFATPLIDGNTITGNTGYGVYFTDAVNAAEITNNTITGNNRPVRLPFSSLPGAGAGNILSPNTKNRIEFWGNTLTRSLVLSSDPVNIYYQAGGTATVATGVRLTIEPGVIWKLEVGSNIDIYGVLSAAGNASEKIVFTSWRDDSFGGDTNGDWFSTGQPGDWGRIYFADSVSDFLTRLEHTVVRYGGWSNSGNVYLNQSNVSLISSDISYGSSYGIYTYNASPLIEGNTITNNGSYGIYHVGMGSSPVDLNNTIAGNSEGIYVQSATPTIDGNTIAGNTDWGIYYNNATNAPVISGNTITGNLRGMMIPASSMPDSTDGNVLAPNSINGVWIRGNARDADMHFEALYPGEAHEVNTYQIHDTVTMNAGRTLTVDPGVVVKFHANAGLNIDGALSAVGTPSLPVVFTSYRDDEYGGDLNADGYATSPANGDWRGIFFSDPATGASCIIDHAVIRYGGGNGSGNLYANQTDLTIRNSIISNSVTNGVRADQASLTLSNNEVFGNSGDGLHLESMGSHTVTGGRVFANLGDGIDISGSVNATVTGSEIFGNVGYGILSSSINTIMATGNWWGAVDGPGGSGYGTGDEVSANVSTSGFLTGGSEFSYFDAGPNTSEGTIPGPAVTRGTGTTEWGSTPAMRVLYDLERAVLDYPQVAEASRYELFIIYYNADDTSGIGGNIQSLTDGNGLEIHGPLAIPPAAPAQYHYRLSAASHDTGDLQLNFIRENGYRAVVSQVWVVERTDMADITAPTSVITSPVVGSQLTGGVVEVTGTATDGAGSGVRSVEVGIDGGSGISWRPVSRLRGDGVWGYRWSLPADGDYMLYSRAMDRAGNREAPGAGVSLVVNQSPPGAATWLSGFDTPMDGGGSISIVWERSADDGAGSDDLGRYDIERREGPEGSFSVVGSVSAGAGSFTDAATVDGTPYYYRLIAIDLAGNRTVSAIYGLVISINNGVPDITPPGDVTGLSGTPGNGYVYLSWTRGVDKDRDLVAQMLDISTDGGGTWGTVGPDYLDGGFLSLSKESGIRLVEGWREGTRYYYVLRAYRGGLESENSNEKSWIPANNEKYALNLSWTVSTSKGVTEQRIYRATTSGGPYSLVMTIPENVTATYTDRGVLSLGREAGFYLVDGLTNGVGYRFRIRVKDSSDNISAGTATGVITPGATAVTPVSETITSDTTWKVGIFHVSGNLTVNAGATLTIQPGVIIKFAPGGAMIVRGTVTAVGTDVNPVVFTAYTDDDYGGDSNGDGPSGGRPGYWDKIYFEDTPSSRMEHVLVRYGGSGDGGNIYLSRSNIRLLSSEISYGSSYGIVTNTSSPLIEGNSISNNVNYGIYHYGGGSPVDRNNTITGNSGGIYVQYDTPVIDGNTITGNTNYGVYYFDTTSAPGMTNNTITGNLIPALIPASALPDHTNVMMPNARNYIGIRGNTIQTDKRLMIWGKGTPGEIHTYVVYTDDIVVPIRTFLTVDPGVIVKFSPDTGIVVNGALVADGTATEKIVFTSFKDDTSGGDTNSDGSDTIPLNGDWRGITFNDSFLEYASRMRHVTVRYGGGNGSGNLFLSMSDILVEDSEISNSSAGGIRIDHASPLIAGNSIWGNNGDGIRLEQDSNPAIIFNRISTNLSDGIEVRDNSNPSATNNQIFMNREYGLRNGTGNRINATQGWWGDPDGNGPYHQTLNPTGTGDQVSDQVDYEPFQTTVGTHFSYRNFSEGEWSTAGSMNPPALIRGSLSDEWDPGSKRPDRTMAWDNNLVIVDYTGLDRTKRYKIRVSYFNGDADGSTQSLTDGQDNPAHGSTIMPTSEPVQYEYLIPYYSYAEGTLTLKFVHDNPEMSHRAAVTEVWLMEYIPDTDPGNLDSDGDGMPDDYEVANLLDPFDNGTTNPNNGTDGDPDLDDHTNFIEYLAGSRAQDRESFPVDIDIVLHKGLNIFGYPVTESAGLTSFGLLSLLGDQTEIEKVLVYDKVNHIYHETYYDGGFPAGESANIEFGDGIIVYSRVVKSVSFNPAIRPFNAYIECTASDLSAGLNVTTFPCVPSGYTSYKMLADVGSPFISSIQRFNTGIGSLETSGYVDGQPVGVDFSIKAGGGYFIHMRQDRLDFRP